MTKKKVTLQTCKELRYTVHINIHMRFLLSQNQLTIMYTTRGERRLIRSWCHIECVENKKVISCRMMHNWIKLYHVVQDLLVVTFSFTDLGRTDRWMDSHMFLFIR